MERHELSREDALRFILAGHSIFTVQNTETGNRFTYRVSRIGPEDSYSGQEVHFCQVLTGGDNGNDYSFFGTLFSKRKYVHSKKSRITGQAPSVKVFLWVVKKLMRKELPDQIKIFHEGYCGRCGTLLTVPDSIVTGYGPVCAKVMGIRYGMEVAA